MYNVKLSPKRTQFLTLAMSSALFFVRDELFECAFCECFLIKSNLIEQLNKVVFT